MAALFSGCQGSAATGELQPAHFEAGASCEAQKSELIQYIGALSPNPLTPNIGADLPESALGRPPRMGVHLEIGETGAQLDGRPLQAPAQAALAAALKDTSRNALLYVVAPAATDVRTVRSYLRAVPTGMAVELLVKVPEVVPGEPKASAAASRGSDNSFAGQLLRERDPARRAELALRGYRQYSKCPAIEQAAAAIPSTPAEQRWPNLQKGLLAALPGCGCQTLDTQNLKQIAIAEQRAGSMSLGSLPIGFLRDERCGASMPLRSMRKLVTQMESFDAEFAGTFQKDELTFTSVLENERLLNFFCDALPGETFAALSRERRTLYFKLANTERCEAMRLEPLSPGAPMGTAWRASPSGSALGFHYWQGAEEIRFYGPLQAGAASSPTDTRDWACNQNVRLSSVDARSIGLEGGRWFFDEEECRKSPAEGNLFTGCAGNAPSPP
ncbi:MAG TPA: hypothetical protein VFQ61_20265 [Polyangiaceae bacterium]|nr:hypothetical protein [Polyangiaceae bacterium]